MNSIIVDKVTKFYGTRAVVSDLSFNVKRGSIHGFLGPNGAGKTTTMKMIAGILTPSSGQVYINGNNVYTHQHEIKSLIGVLLEVAPLFKDMEVGEYLKFVCAIHGKDKNLSSFLVEQTINKLGLGPVAKRLIGNLSKGFKQRVGIAQAIVFGPEIVILDEPTVGLDPNSVIEMRGLIKELAIEHTVLLSSHQLHEIGLICDEITIINQGKIQLSGSMQDIVQQVSQQQVLICHVRRFDQNMKNQLEQLPSINNVEAIPHATYTELRMNLFSLEDCRDEISKWMIDKNLGVLEFYREKMDLEKIFLQVTGEKK
jgi:ABC-2 type transport system ATP-binding protein